MVGWLAQVVRFMDSTIYKPGLEIGLEEQGNYEAAVGWLYGGVGRLVDIRELNGDFRQPVRKCLVQD